MEYLDVFVDVNDEYWLDNDAMHNMTYNASYMLSKIYKDVTKYAQHHTFR